MDVDATLNFQAVNGCVLATEKKNKSILFEDHSTYKIEQVSVKEERQIFTPGALFTHSYAFFCRSLETLVWYTVGWVPTTGSSSAEPERWHRFDDAGSFWELA